MLDMTTCLICDPLCLNHLTGFGHPESPARFQAIDKILSSHGIKHSSNSFKPRMAIKKELILCHTNQYIECVESDIKKCMNLRLLDGSYTLSTGDVQICPDSWNAALLAVGGALTGVDLVMQQRGKNAFSYLRPPGHHACSDRGMGFCIFNNVAIAARYVQQKYGLKRVLIVDWDVHHGNGTQEIFDADPSVFYFSTHQLGIYPGTGSADDRGIGQAVGTKMNFPISAGIASRKDVLAAFQGPLVEAMKHFKPEFILISAGFDAHYSDPLGGFNLTEQDFAALTAIVMKIADAYAQGRVVSLLEGGYHLEGLARSALEHAKKLSAAQA